MSLIILLLSCTNSGLGLNPTADTGPLTVGCPWEGEWELAVVDCGSFPYADEWNGTYDDAEMVITAEGENSCAVAFSWSSGTCSEEEAWEIVPTIPELTEDEEDEWEYDGRATVNYQGITSCDPDGCEFEQGEMSFTEAACEEGDRTISQEIEIDTSIDDQLKIEGLLNDPGRHDCQLGLVTTWRRK